MSQTNSGGSTEGKIVCDSKFEINFGVKFVVVVYICCWMLVSVLHGWNYIYLYYLVYQTVYSG